MKKFIFIYVMGLLTCSSCSDFLDVEPQLQISHNEQFATEEGVREIARGIYYELEAITSSKTFIYPDLMGGNLIFTPSVTSAERNVDPRFAMTYGFQDMAIESDFASLYEDHYDMINQVNLVLERLGQLTFLSDTDRDQLHAELLVIRAYMHYQVSLMWAQHGGFYPRQKPYRDCL
jgi:hypothetical protein